MIALQAKPATPDLNFLRKVGDGVRRSIGANVWAAIQASRAKVHPDGIRIVFYIDASAVRQVGPNQVRPDEVPLELMWDIKEDFYALNMLTPVTRGISVEADRTSHIVPVPLKVLVVVCGSER